MLTIVSRMSKREHRALCGLVAGMLDHLKWRHNGLGLLQAYVQEGETDELRVHIWHPLLKRPGIEESGLIHDHRFDLESQVIVGRLTQIEYTGFVEDHLGDWAMHGVVHAREAMDKHATNDGLVSELPGRWSCTTSVAMIEDGEIYTFPKRKFHSTHAQGLTITLLTKSNQDAIPARILAPYGKPVVHAFADPLPESAWQQPLSDAREALLAMWRYLK